MPSAIVATGIMSASDMEAACEANERTMILLQKMYAERGLDLWDIKIEWGKDAETGELLLIDEVSAGCCRAFDLKTGEELTAWPLPNVLSNN